MWRVLRENIPEKLMALSSAILIWLYVNAERNPTITQRFTVDVEVQHIQNGYEPPALNPPQVTVVLTGVRSSVEQIAPRAIRAMVDASGMSEGKQRLPVQLNLTRELLRDVQVEVVPPAVQVTLTRRISKELKIECLFVNTPPEGYVYLSPILFPETAVVSGAREKVNQVKRLIVNAVPQRVGEEVDEDLPIVALDADNRPISGGVTIRPSYTRVVLKLTPVSLTKTVLVTPVWKGKPDPSIAIEEIAIEPRTVVISGKPEVLAQVHNVETEPIDIDNLTSDMARNVALRPVEGVHLTTSSVRVAVRVRRLPERSERSERPAP
ncbi:MAG: CdaR family protein [Armatimonadota bacterium]|nr:CdaR family protein [bacterium]MDW8322249.1 CdaR family protein [Armatimonadota bacterium]